MSERKVPKLRFAGFTDDWKQRKLGEVVFQIKSYSLSRNVETNKDTGFKYVHYGDIHRNIAKLISSENNLPSIQKGNYEFLQKGDLVIADASEDYEGIGNACLIDCFLSRNIVAGLHTIALRPTEVNSLFLYYLLHTDIFSKYGKVIATGTKVFGITAKNLLNFEFNLPSETEQQAIGEFFKQLDDTIAFHQREWEKYKNLKISYLEKMFPQENENKPQLRFPNFTDAWKQRKLKDISQKVLEKNLNMEFLETFTNSAELGIISQRDFFDKDIANVNNLSGYYIVRNNDFVYNPRISNFAPVGPIKRNKLGRSGAMSPLYYVFRVCDEIDFAFLETYFSSTKWHSFMKENGDTGARADRLSIKDNVFIEMPIYFPTLPEQQAIGEFFKQLDDTIAFHQRELEKYKNLKNGYLKQMFV
ncbi:restriction endonuclease subunit S [Moraxella nasibovis]|uniref:restriction endonuclease subunit S n=1 Tax=Moraxella nasibovis TaxID=2904120 RepID=UPI00240F446D|nr:restriction endonuclease subunit S [Moraxella nasibovis]WFF38822.1 restriction endonuclease subunit S [Moraxella nasibovis]